jgi:dipeptidyl aminopeptidase/acylaminoacyl peptidase
MVRGDMGGEDTHDYLRGIDALVEQGIADPKRIGVTGISYGGYMSAWLITQDQRFAAAVPISPTSNWYSQHRTSQIPCFDELFLEASASEPGGKFFDRSPVMFADRVTCPTLTLTGAKDRTRRHRRWSSTVRCWSTARLRYWPPIQRQGTAFAPFPR